MSDKLMQKLTAMSIPKATTATNSEEPDVVDDFGSFGWLRGVRERSLMLELRKSNGNILAVGYGWLEKVGFDPSEGITLHLTGQKVRIRGRNLNTELRPLVRLFEGIVRHQVPWIQEASPAAAMRAEKGETVVEAIEW